MTFEFRAAIALAARRTAPTTRTASNKALSMFLGWALKRAPKLISRSTAPLADAPFGLALHAGAVRQGLCTRHRKQQHRYLDPDLFQADTPLGAYQGVTDQVRMSITSGAYRHMLVPRGSCRAEWEARG
jgi:hypothetical protein